MYHEHACICYICRSPVVSLPPIDVFLGSRPSLICTRFTTMEQFTSRTISPLTLPSSDSNSSSSMGDNQSKPDSDNPGTNNTQSACEINTSQDWSLRLQSSDVESETGESEDRFTEESSPWSECSYTFKEVEPHACTCSSIQHNSPQSSYDPYESDSLYSCETWISEEGKTKKQTNITETIDTRQKTNVMYML